MDSILLLLALQGEEQRQCLAFVLCFSMTSTGVLALARMYGLCASWVVKTAAAIALFLIAVSTVLPSSETAAELLYMRVQQNQSLSPEAKAHIENLIEEVKAKEAATCSK